VIFDAGKGSVVVFGGVGPRSLLADTWIGTDQGWKEVRPSVSPPARSGAAIAYDYVTQSVVLFGGRNGAGKALDDTWLWNGTTWAQVQTVVSPSPRAQATMAFDAARNTVVLFGGGYSRGRQPAYLADTWLWTGNSWKEVHPGVSPSPRAGAAVAYHAATQKLVLFGGGVGHQLADTWTWDGSWRKEELTVNPQARTGAAAAHHELLDKVVIFGGWSGERSKPILHDTWRWDGTAWTEEHQPSSPPPAYGTSMAYDPRSKSLILIGWSGGKQDQATEIWHWK
jgi:hypothetical protein